jgi:hypothetical protein
MARQVWSRPAIGLGAERPTVHQSILRLRPAPHVRGGTRPKLLAVLEVVVVQVEHIDCPLPAPGTCQGRG